MQYIFENYKFDANQQILTKDEKIVALKSNEAKLLHLFLSRPNEILSKETILNEVWGDRIVSEQVVFQNISQLRTLFSDKAIKTFPKKGYQWQLDIKPEQSSKKLTAKAPIFTAKLSAFVAVTAITVTLLFILFNTPVQLSTEHKVKRSIKVIPFEYSQGSLTDSAFNKAELQSIALIKPSEFKFELLSPPPTARSFFNEPLLTWQTVSQNEQDLLLSGFVTTHPDGLLMRYQLQGVNRSWTGYLFASSNATLLQKLQIHLGRILNSQYLTLKDDALVTSELSLLNNKYPDDHEILLRLIERQLAQKNYDIAMALLDTLIAQSDAKQHTAYLGLGYMLKGKVFHLQRFLDKAEHLYLKAHQVLASRNLLLLQSLVAKNEGWLAFFRENFAQTKTALYQAASLAKLAGEPLAEIEAYTLLSILSNKLGFDKEKYDSLYKAKSLLINYKLDKANFAVIYYHFALFAENKEKAQPYFEKILALPYKQDNAWIIEDAQKELAKYYIADKAWQQALKLFAGQHTSAFSFNQRAQIYYAMGEQAKALINVKRAFSQARINYQHTEALNAALLLYRISLQIKDVTGQIEYRTYIENNAFQHWLKRNKDALKALGYFENQNTL